MQTRKNKVIFYTGVGARKNFKHTSKQFRKITRKVYSKKECRQMKERYKKYGMGHICPPQQNTNGWVKLVGAEYITAEE
jgi:hypothetical protein